MATKIKDKVQCQLYGDIEFEKQIIEALKSAGVNVAVTSSKEYVTKKGEEGYYYALKLTYEENGK